MHINAAQKLLKRLNPTMPGLENVLFSYKYEFEEQQGEFLQILYTENHWITIYATGMANGEVLMYDSMHCKLSTDAKTQIVCILATDLPAIEVNFMDVQRQCGGSECGLYAIAFATALACGNNPTNYIFDQKEMRQHFISCLEKGTISMFPIRKERRRQKRNLKKKEKIKISCVCRMPELPTTKLIECSLCKEWFHFTCMNMDENSSVCNTI